MILILLLSIFVVLFVWNYYVHYGSRRGRLINRIPGPPPVFPIAGNILEYQKGPDVLWKLLIYETNFYYPIVKVWSFFQPFVSIRHPDDLEIILSPVKHLEKSVIYDILLPWFNTGLLTSTGLGDFQKKYRDAVHEMGLLLIYRLMRPWMYQITLRGLFFDISPAGFRQRKLLRILHDFTDKIIKERKLYHERTGDRYLKSFENDKTEEDDSKYIGTTRCGHDTTAVGICFFLLLMAEHKDIQVLFDRRAR
ncbi:hypothetical protein DMN91_000538 [Ooceraea biroi]|uniref:Cytochrome P450 4C1 n=1 Tax=Ooceraea biroi TaxID=2015173 RepID=A0A3L8E1Z1_OOCBI|nr:hypothetical protein DMN91_000538 [Ooceraea biroi]